MNRNSHLIQRLYPPINHENPFAFGGGLKKGGLSDSAMDSLRSIFSFDYMGAAEFEFGALPKALSKIAASDLGTAQFDLEGTTVYILAPSEWLEEVESRVRSWILPYKERPYMKEQPGLDEIITGKTPVMGRPSWRRTRGWLEINNGWFAFIDREMWEKTCRLFGVDTTDQT